MKLTMTSKSSSKAIELENMYGAHNYAPLPVVLEKGEGVYVWDVDGKKYFDFLSAYSAVNQGHCHPRIIKALIDQAHKLTLTSRAFHSNLLGSYEQFMCNYFGYDKILPMNTGAEGVETALKLARKWAYLKKGIPENEAIIVACENNFHGRTISIISMSNDPDARKDFGPYTPGIIKVEYNNIDALKKVIASNKNIAAFICEPVQGEAGVIIPDKGYLKSCYTLCKENNVLFIADEIQSGLGRTGKKTACEHDDIKPDVLILGKALSGGTLPVSAVLADNDIMLCIKPGQHGSTYGGNPLACAVAMEAIKVLEEENLYENSKILGELLLTELKKIKSNYIKSVRGIGLWAAIEVNEQNGKDAKQICYSLMENGLLAKQTHETIIRLAPPLCITKDELLECIAILNKVFTS